MFSIFSFVSPRSSEKQRPPTAAFEPSRKRLRSDSDAPDQTFEDASTNTEDASTGTGNSEPPPPKSAVLEALGALTQEEIREFLLNACQSHPETWTKVSALSEQKIAAQRALVIDFKSTCDSIDKALNVKYLKLSCSKQFDAAGDMIDSIDSAIVDIAHQAISTRVSFGTRKNALDAIISIGLTAVQGQEEIGKQVRNHYAESDPLTPALVTLLKKLSDEEKEEVLYEKGTETKEFAKFTRNMMILTNLAQDNYCFSKLKNVWDVMGVTYDGLNEKHGSW